MKYKVGVVSLGCDKNRVDSEIMLGYLVNGGYEITNNCTEADVIIVNTCAFLESARAEAIDTVIEMSEHKKDRCKLLVVTGCLGQHCGVDLYKYLDETDLILGINEYPNIASIITKALASNDRALITSPCTTEVSTGDRVLTTLSHTAYLKIADGCNNFCSFCLIPHIRGRYRSRSLDSIIAEAKQLVGAGVKEIILVAQDVTRYGHDLFGRSQITTLLEALNDIEGLAWIRLLYCYPELVTDELLDAIDKCTKVVRYLDIPLQHIDDKMLSLMNRRANEQQTRVLFDKLAEREILTRSTFICGFPNETPETHQAVADFLNKYKLCNVGFFPYSREEGTPSYNMPNQIDERDKQDMVSNLYQVQADVSRENMANYVGKKLTCLVDGVSDDDKNIYIGRSYFMTPDVDGVVYVHSNEKLNTGDFYEVIITNSGDFDLNGEV